MTLCRGPSPMQPMQGSLPARSLHRDAEQTRSSPVTSETSVNAEACTDLAQICDVPNVGTGAIAEPA